MSVRRSTWLLLALAVGASCPLEPDDATAVSEVTPVTVGARIEREIRVGETHRYSIELRAGEYFQALVEQREMDVEEAVLGPDGRPLLEMDTFSARSGPEPLAVVAQVSGVHTVTIRANDGDRAPPAGYLLHVQTVRDPTPDDLLRVRTVHATGGQARLFGKGPAESRKALELGLEAVKGWQALGDRRMEMSCEQGTGTIQRADFGDYKEAKPPFERALAAARELGDVASEGQLLFNLGITNGKLGLFDEARARFEENLAIHRASGRREREAYVLLMFGRMELTAGDAQQALDLLHQVLEVYPVAVDGTGLPVAPHTLALIYTGDAYLELGEYELALAQYRKAASELGDRNRNARTNRARVSSGIGAALFGQRDLAGARAAYAEALRILRELGAPAFAAETSLRAGDVQREEGDLAGALELYASALTLFSGQGDPVGQATAHCRLGEVHRRLGAADAARSAFEAALAAGPARSESLEACAQQGLARLAASADDLKAARAHADAALAAAEASRAAVASHRTRATLLAAQQSLYELLIDVRMREHEADPAGGHDAAALEVSERARARSLLELLSESRIEAGDGVAPSLLQEERTLRHRLNAAAEVQQEALAAKRVERAEALGGEILDLTARLAEVQGRIRRASPRYAALTQPQPATLPQIQRDLLDDDTLLLEYMLGESESRLWVLSTRHLASVRLAPRAEIERAARAVYDGLSVPARAGAQAAGARASWLRDLDALSELLLPVQARGLLDLKRLLVVAPGALQYVPFGILRLSQASPAPLLERFEVVSAPSASVIATLRRESAERSPPSRIVAAFADPVFERSDPRVAAARARPVLADAPAAARTAGPEPLDRALRSARGTQAAALARLPFSGREAEAIAALAPAGQIWKATGFEASREAATRQPLAEYRIVHFATHGLLNAERPELSGLVLSLVDREGRKQDGFLRLHDVYNLTLGAELVVLSGCQTALGREMGGEGLLGLTRGFMYAGARGVVASLWQVDDESTAELMKRFYRAMLKERKRPADALRTAQLELARQPRWSAPFYWAGFVLQGDWR